MYKKIALAVMVFFTCPYIFAQTNKPNFEAIEKAIQDKASPFYYEALMKRYAADDTTLTTQEYQYLYYGFSFQKKYSPYGSSAVEEDLKKAISSNEIGRVIQLEKKVLEEFPFNLRNMYMLSAMYEKKGDQLAADLYNKKMMAVAKAILSSGDGTTDTTAIYVISVAHEYDLIALMGYKFGSGQSLVQTKDGPADKMELAKNDDNLEYLYFNVQCLFADMKKTFKKH